MKKHTNTQTGTAHRPFPTDNLYKYLFWDRLIPFETVP